MSTRIDVLSRSIAQFTAQSGTQDTSATQVPVIAEGEGSFGNTLKRVINEVSDASERSGSFKDRFLAGDKNVELHQVMAASEEAGIAMDLLIELRNKTVEAYRSVINMQS